MPLLGKSSHNLGTETRQSSFRESFLWTVLLPTVAMSQAVLSPGSVLRIMFMKVVGEIVVGRVGRKQPIYNGSARGQAERAGM